MGCTPGPGSLRRGIPSGTWRRSTRKSTHGGKADGAVLTRAILRRPGPDFAAGITTATLGAPDLSRMLAQHAAYADALRVAGLEVEVLGALPGFPDSYFVEDVAVVFPELAVIA